MRPVVTRVVLFAFCLAPLAFASENKCPEPALAIPVCKVLADAAKYDGKDVTVRGLYYRVIHGSILTAPACEKLKVNMRLAPDWKGEKGAVAALNSLARRNQPADVVLRGTLRVAHEGCFGQTCSLYEIEEHHLLCAGVPRPETNADAGNSQ